VTANILELFELVVCLVFCLKLVKYVMVHLDVMMHIVLASRYKVLSKIQKI